MKYQQLFTLLLLFLFLSCKEKANPNKYSLNEGSSLALTEEQVFVIESDSVSQKLLIKYFDSDSINYRIIVSSKIANCKQELVGTAINRFPDMDPELDEDFEGITYPAVEYWDSKDDKLAIRVEMNSAELARIKSSRTSNSIEHCNWLLSQNLMKRNSQYIVLPICRTTFR